MNKFSLLCLACLATTTAFAQSKVEIPDVPDAITSFGAATTNAGHVYIYGGHKGGAHKYNIEGQSNAFLRLDTKKSGSKWENLPTGPKLQGLALVTDGTRLFRVGGFTALNKGDEKAKLKSQASFAMFDPKTNKWTDLAPMPTPRSSFDAVVHKNHLFVIGGWNMQPEDSTWATTALVADLKASPITWKELPKPPFQKRALSVAAVGDSIYAIGGMQEKGGPTKAVSMFNTKTSKWSEGPELPGESGMAGFGSSSFAMFDPKTNKWTDLAPMPTPRSSFDAVVHKNHLFVIGGWNMQPEDSTWATTALVADLKASPITWKELPKPPFQKRALSVAAVGDSIYAIGGMQEKGGPTKAVSMFNTKTSKWSEGPELPGESGMAGFGSSSFAIGNQLFASTYEGKLLELSADGKQWKTLKTFEEGRFFHRMIPMNKSALLMISGANMEIGKYSDVIVVPVTNKQTASVR